MTKKKKERFNALERGINFKAIVKLKTIGDVQKIEKNLLKKK